MVRRPPRSPPFPSTTLSRSVTYTPTATAGSHKVIATYDESSSALHAGSSGSYTISVDRRSVVKGKSDDLGGRRIIKKKRTATLTEPDQGHTPPPRATASSSL